MAEILNARVQQKVDTEAGWLAAEAELGVVLAGEQAFVLDPTGTVLLNFKIGDGTKLFSELPYFITYFSNVLNQKVLSFINGNTNITIGSTFRQFSCLYDIIVINNSGTNIDLKVGTTSGANDLFEITLNEGVSSINLRKVFSDVSTVFLSGLAGKSYSIFVVYFQYDENPAIPPTGGDTPFAWPKCFKGIFEPLGPTDLDDNWDFTTGLGKANTPWANCAISGTNGTQSMARVYATGWQVGDTLYPAATTFGAPDTGEITLSENNLPIHSHKLFSGAPPVGNLSPDPTGVKTAAWTSNHTSGNQDYDMKQAGDNNRSIGATNSFGQEIPDPIDVRPFSKVQLYFVAIS
jgi:hypothetical protein